MSRKLLVPTCLRNRLIDFDLIEIKGFNESRELLP